MKKIHVLKTFFIATVAMENIYILGWDMAETNRHEQIFREWYSLLHAQPREKL